MPYVPKVDRPYLDKKVEVVANDIVKELKGKLSPQISEIYRRKFIETADTLSHLERRIRIVNIEIPTKPTTDLGNEIFEVAKKYEYPGAWLGELNYSITTLIQAVPSKMVENGEWNEALRYWLYAVTAGALERTASEIDKKGSNHWIENGLVGVFLDVKDEWKRRVNAPYEAEQIRKNGDCYDKSPYRTQLIETPFPVKGPNGVLIEDTLIEVFLPKQEPKK